MRGSYPNNKVESSGCEGRRLAERPGDALGTLMSQTLVSQAVTAADVYRALWRHKVLILVLTAVFVGATWYVTSRVAKTYEASALVRIQQPITNAGDAFNSLESSARLAQTYAKVINSGALNDPTRAALASKLPALRTSPTLSASPVQDLDLVWISARSHDPTVAAVAANVAADQLHQFTSRTSTIGEQVLIIKKATAPTSPISPRVGFNLGLALVLGLIFNSALALLIEVFRDRMPDPEELGQSLGYPVLATIPTLQLRRIATNGGSANGRSPEEAGVSTDDGSSNVGS